MASKLNPYPMPPDGDLAAVNMNALRGHILGVSLDNTVTPGVDDWFITSGAAGNRNALTTSEKIITRLLNAMNIDIAASLDAVKGFSERFTNVIGSENSTDKQAYDRIGSNLINTLANLQDLSTDLVGLPEWDSTDYTLTFRTGAGDEVVVNLPLEALAMGLDYDHDTQEIILIKYDGSEIRVNIGDLVSLYEGYESSTITTDVITENKIKATINLASIGSEHLKDEVLEQLGGARVSTQDNNMITQLPDGLYVPKVSEVAISSEPDNLIEKKPDGLYVPEISADTDNYVGIIISDPASESDKQIFPMGSVKPPAYLVGQFYAVLFTNGHTASTLRLAFDQLPFRNVVYNNDYLIPSDLIPKGSMHLFAYSGTNFIYVGKNFEQLAEGLFTTPTLPAYKTFGELAISALLPASGNERLMLNSMIIDDEGKLAKVKGISEYTVTVYTIKDSNENETAVDHDSVRYNSSDHLETVKFVDNQKNAAIGKITNEPVDLAQTELSIQSQTNHHRIISIRKPDDTVAWQLRIDKGNLSTLNIDDDDDLLNRGQIVDLMHTTIGTGLHIPIYLELESALPVITELTPDGMYYIIGDMDITAPGHEGRAWVNLSISAAEYQIVVDKGVDADGDWIIFDSNNDLTLNLEKVIMDIGAIDIQEDTGKLASLDALLQVDSKVADTFRGRVKNEDAFPLDALKGNWVMIDDCNLTSPGNPGLGVFDGNDWIICAFEVGMGDLDIIPEPSDDGELYFRSKEAGFDGVWVKYDNINGAERLITLNVKDSVTGGTFIPEKGEFIYLEDIVNFTIGDGVTKLSALPLMFIPDATLPFTPENIANKGVAQGYAPLDSFSKIPPAFLPDTITESYTESQIDTLLFNLQQTLQTNINQEITDRQSADQDLENKIDDHVDDENIHVTSLEKASWDSKLEEVALQPFNNHIQNDDIHVTLMDKIKWDGNVAAYLVYSIAEMNALDPLLLKLGDTCFVRLTASGVTPVQYAEFIWYGTDGWIQNTNTTAIVNVEWAGINNKPAASAMDIDNTVTLAHRHMNAIVLNRIDENVSGNLTYNGVPIGATVIFLANDLLLPPIGQADALYVIYRDSRLNNFPSISVWRTSSYEILGGGSGGGGISPSGDAVLQQRNLFSVVSGSQFLLPVPPSEQFAFFPIEILKLVEGPKNQILTYTTFSNPSIFNFHKDLIKIQNGLSVGPYPIPMNLDTVSGTRYYYETTINLDNFHSVQEIF